LILRTAAVLPVKRFALAKQRLGHSVADPLRRELAEAMVADVLDVLGAVSALQLTLVVTNEPAVRRLAGAHGACLVPDTLEAGQSAAAALGIERACRSGAQRVLLVPGDCPAVDAGELDQLLSDPAPGPTVAIVPDRHGTGTNALLLTPGEIIAPAFGPDSRERHRLLALAAGAACRVERLASLALDIDTGADLQLLRDRLRADGSAEAAGHAPRTRAVLAGVPEPPDALDADLAPAP
jgi:2-phospho-L-lactate guanylyltransferase